MTKKNSSLHIFDHGKYFLYNQQKLLIGDSKQTVEIVKIRMKGGKELAVKMERESECESYKEHCTACIPLFLIIFEFLSYSVQIKPLEVDREASVTTREAKQVPGSHSQGMVIPTGPRSSALLQGWEPDACKGGVSRGNCSGGRAGALEGQYC